MAIQNRRGAKKDFDATKMLPGEIAVTTDGSRKVYAAFAPGDVKELASAEEVQEIVDGFNEDVEENIQKATDEIEQKKEEALAEIPNYEQRLAELETYKANSIIQTSSGTTFHETDCAAVPPINIKLLGKGKQRQYEGNQLANFNDFVGTTKSYCYVREFKLIAGTMTMGIELENNSSGAHIDFVNDNGEKITSVGATIDGNTFQLTQEQVDAITQINFFVYNELAGSKVKSVMLNEGDTLKPYEPYVGNEPSPNMNYPQIPEFLGEGGSIVGKVLSGNLYDPSFRRSYDGLFNANNCTATEENGLFNIIATGTDITLWDICYGEYDSYNHHLNGQLMKVCDAVDAISINLSNYEFNKNYINFYDNNMKSLGAVPIMSNKGTATILDGAKYFTLRFGKGDAVVGTTYKTTVMVNYGEPKPYEPYTEQPFTFQTPNGLRGIPLGKTIPDAIKNSPIHMSGVYHDGEQYWIGDTKNENGKDVQRIVREIISSLPGYVGFTKDDDRGIKYIQFVNNDGNKMLFTNENYAYSLLLSNMFLPIGWEAGDSGVIGIVQMSDTSYRVYVPYDSDIESVEDFKQIISETPLEIYGILANPIITDTTEEEKAQLDALVMNYPNTTIVNDAGAYMEVEYVADTQKHIEQNYVSKAMHEEHESRIAELEKAIVNS